MNKTETTPEIEISWIGGNCPVQAEGTINGKEFYFRARGDSWSLRIGGSDVVGNPDWYYEEDYIPPDGGDPTFAAGWMTETEARAFLVRAAQRYANEQR